MAVIQKLKKVFLVVRKIVFILFILAAVGFLYVEMVKLQNGEESYFDQIAVAVADMSFDVPLPLSQAVAQGENDESVEFEKENSSDEKASKSRDESRQSKAVKNAAGVENNEKNKPNEEIKNAAVVPQEPPKQAENFDLPPEKIVFYPNLAEENIRLLNAERKKRGIPELKVHDGLMNVAHIKVDDMMTYNYYGHGSPRLGHTTTLIGDMVGSSSRRSENLNLTKKPTYWYRDSGHLFSSDLKQMAQWAHNSLMGSDGHRENMLNPELVYVGVAAAGNVIIEDGEEYYVFKVAQVFMSEPW